MNKSQMQGSSLLAGLYKQMERMSEVQRVVRALKKRPQARSMLDIEHLMEETQNIIILTKDGPGVHRDMCHVLRVKQLDEGESLRLHKEKCMYWVLLGRAIVRTTEEQVENMRNPLHDKEKKGKEKAGDKAASATVTELRALFDSIDQDGSGAIDAEEMKTALELMGIHLSDENMAELMDGVDDDGSGELEFEEFVEIMTTKLGLGAKKEKEWALDEYRSGQEGGDWFKEFTENQGWGEKCLHAGAQYTCTIVAQEKTALLVLDQGDYEEILLHGFGGDLKLKQDLLARTAVARQFFKTTDLKALAYAANKNTYPVKTILLSQDQPPGSVFILVEGECTVTCRKHLEMPEPMQLSVTAAALEKGSLSFIRGDGGGKKSRMRNIDVAVLVPGEIFGDEAILKEERNRYTVTAATAVTAFALELRAFERLVSVPDLNALRAHLKHREERRARRLEEAVDTTHNTTMRSKALMFAHSTDAVARMSVMDNSRVQGYDPFTELGFAPESDRPDTSGRGWEPGTRPGSSSSKLGAGGAGQGTTVGGFGAARFNSDAQRGSGLETPRGGGDKHRELSPSRLETIMDRGGDRLPPLAASRAAASAQKVVSTSAMLSDTEPGSMNERQRRAVFGTTLAGLESNDDPDSAVRLQPVGFEDQRIPSSLKGTLRKASHTLHQDKGAMTAAEAAQSPLARVRQGIRGAAHGLNVEITASPQKAAPRKQELNEETLRELHVAMLHLSAAERAEAEKKLAAMGYIPPDPESTSDVGLAMAAETAAGGEFQTPRPHPPGGNPALQHMREAQQSSYKSMKAAVARTGGDQGSNHPSGHATPQAAPGPSDPPSSSQVARSILRRGGMKSGKLVKGKSTATGSANALEERSRLRVESDLGEAGGSAPGSRDGSARHLGLRFDLGSPSSLSRRQSMSMNADISGVPLDPDLQQLRSGRSASARSLSQWAQDAGPGHEAEVGLPIAMAVESQRNGNLLPALGRPSGSANGEVGPSSRLQSAQGTQSPSFSARKQRSLARKTSERGLRLAQTLEAKAASLQAFRKQGINQIAARAVNKLLTMGPDTQMEIISRQGKRWFETENHGRQNALILKEQAVKRKGRKIVVTKAPTLGGARKRSPIDSGGGEGEGGGGKGAEATHVGDGMTTIPDDKTQGEQTANHTSRTGVSLIRAATTQIAARYLVEQVKPVAFNDYVFTRKA